MRDQFRRRINYMRISLTDRCNLHCRYCRPQTAQPPQREEELSCDDLLRICGCAVNLGIVRFKITGGEPLLRRDAASFISRLKRMPGVEQVTLTTNGTLLAQQLPQLLRAGTDAVNISLDTLDGAAYRELTGGRLQDVLEGIRAAELAGLPFKLNCVLLRSASRERDLRGLLRLLAFAGRCGAPLRFIELMPLACNRGLRGYGGAELRSLLEEAGVELTPETAVYGSGPAVYYRAEAYAVSLGFIEPLQNKFCAACTRVRLTSRGILKPCLYGSGGCDLRGLLRSGASDAQLAEALAQAVYHKPAGHSFELREGGFAMSEIGG